MTGPTETTTPTPPERMMVVRIEGIEAGDCEPVVAALEQFTPLAEGLRPGLHAFETRGPSRYFGGEQALAELVAEAVADAAPKAPRVGVGAADGLFVAGLAARTAPPMPGAPAARPAEPRPQRAAPAVRAAAAPQSSSGLPDPTAVLVVPPGGTHRRSGLRPGRSTSTAVLVVSPRQGRRFLAGLPLVSLADPVSPLSADDGAEALLDVLWRLGMRTLGHLAEMDEADMLGRFGRPGLLAHRLARGLDDRPLQARPAPESSAVEAEINPPAERIETVAFMARPLADNMVARLARNGLDCVSVGIEAESDSGHASRRRWRHELRFDAAAVVDRVRWQLEGWYRSPERPTGPVTLIRITACAVAPADGRQLGMWGERSAADERAARALARVQGLLGAEAVTVPRLADGRRPADIGRRVPLHETEADASPAQDPSRAAPGKGEGQERETAKPSRIFRTAATGVRKHTAVKTSKAAGSADAPWLGRLPPPQPAVVLARPEPVTVTDRDCAPVTVSGRGEASAPPQQLTDSAGRSQAVVAWAGPWPLDERWWRPSARRRQARFQLVLDDGSAHLCVLESGRWHREAAYD